MAPPAAAGTRLLDDARTSGVVETAAGGVTLVVSSCADVSDAEGETELTVAGSEVATLARGVEARSRVDDEAAAAALVTTVVVTATVTDAVATAVVMTVVAGALLVTRMVVVGSVVAVTDTGGRVVDASELETMGVEDGAPMEGVEAGTPMEEVASGADTLTDATDVVAKPDDGAGADCEVVAIDGVPTDIDGGVVEVGNASVVVGVTVTAGVISEDVAVTAIWELVAASEAGDVVATDGADTDTVGDTAEVAIATVVVGFTVTTGADIEEVVIKAFETARVVTLAEGAATAADAGTEEAVIGTDAPAAAGTTAGVDNEPVDIANVGALKLADTLDKDGEVSDGAITVVVGVAVTAGLDNDGATAVLIVPAGSDTLSDVEVNATDVIAGTEVLNEGAVAPADTVPMELAMLEAGGEMDADEGVADPTTDPTNVANADEERERSGVKTNGDGLRELCRVGEVVISDETVGEATTREEIGGVATGDVANAGEATEGGDVVGEVTPIARDRDGVKDETLANDEIDKLDVTSKLAEDADTDVMDTDVVGTLTNGDESVSEVNAGVVIAETVTLGVLGNMLVVMPALDSKELWSGALGETLVVTPKLDSEGV